VNVDIPLIIGWYAVFVFSATVHEASHAWIANLGGDPTAYEGGQVSLNPLPHMKREPVGMIVIPLLLAIIGYLPFGFASAPYDPRWAYSHPKRAAMMALAGPVSNLLLALICMMMMWLGLQMHFFNIPDSIGFMQIVTSAPHETFDGMAYLLSMLFSMNILLFVINMMPVPPLDGSGVLPLFMAQNTARRYLEIVNQPFLFFIGIFLVWKLGFEIFLPVYQIFITILYGFS